MMTRQRVVGNGSETNDDKITRPSLRSPIRPQYPAPEARSTETTTAGAPQQAPSSGSAEDPQAALSELRHKIDVLLDEFAAGRLNRAQFHALYSRYNEQRAIIERLVERDPGSDAWRQVAASRGQTNFLRANLAARSLSLSVFLRGQFAPVLAAGKRPLDAALTQQVLRSLWEAPSDAMGMGRRALDHGHWLLCAVGELSATLVVYSLEPSLSQAQLVRDLHMDFERANRLSIARGHTATEMLVFPQRALIETAAR
jgi:hypothetical protein